MTRIRGIHNDHPLTTTIPHGSIRGIIGPQGVVKPWCLELWQGVREHCACVLALGVACAATAVLAGCLVQLANEEEGAEDERKGKYPCRHVTTQALPYESIHQQQHALLEHIASGGKCWLHSMDCKSYGEGKQDSFLCHISAARWSRCDQHMQDSATCIPT